MHLDRLDSTLTVRLWTVHWACRSDRRLFDPALPRQGTICASTSLSDTAGPAVRVEGGPVSSPRVHFIPLRRTLNDFAVSSRELPGQVLPAAADSVALAARSLFPRRIDS